MPPLLKLILIRIGLECEDRDCHIVAVEIADNMTFSEELTPELKGALPQILGDIEAHVLVLLAS
jgi:hypothetical protein